MPAETINCPICQQPMQKQDIPQGVEIDFCDAHGVWLDAGEFELIAKADEARSQATAPAAAKPTGSGGSIAATVGSVVAGAGVRALIRSFFGRRF